MELTRRSFVSTAAAGAALTAAAGTVAVARAEEAAPAASSDIVWNAEFDVVVMGFGFAGASAALAASEAGASVLLTDKAPLNHEGGNSRYCAQLCLSPAAEDRDAAITYYKGLRGLYDDQSDEVIECLVDGLISNYQWMLDHGAAEEDIISYPFPEFPELEGADSARALLYKGSWMSQFYKFVHGLVLQDANITRWNSTPVVDLIQDSATKVIVGVVVENGGERYNVRAKNGVVMACGGFENNQAMLQNFVQQPNAYSKGARYNTGDGVKMAISVGADLWHMSALSGADVNFIDPVTGISAGYALTHDTPTGYCTAFTCNNVIIVGSDGSRFLNETYFPRHGHISYGGTYRSILVPDNCWCIFDETARQAGKAYHSWSDGMVDEIEKGWVVQADTIEGLAELVGIDPTNLANQVALYNECCANGDDYLYHRAPEYLLPLETAPFYAFELRPTNTNTQGGARRNTNCEVVDTKGEPIPHLYSAGEFGSFYTDIYNGGGNVGECIFTGDMAGKAAAAVKDDATQDSLMGDTTPVDFHEERPEYAPEADNEFIGVGDGIGGDLVVKVTMDGETMTAIEVLYNNETPNIGSKAIEQLIPAMLESQQTVVDAVTGCTVTSYALMNAVNDALQTGTVVSEETDVEAILEQAAASVD